MVLNRVALRELTVSKMADFVADRWPIDGARSELHVGDVYATLFYKSTDDIGAIGNLWYDGDRLQAISLYRGLTFDMAIVPEAAAGPLADEMIAWAGAETIRRDPAKRVVRIGRRPMQPDFVRSLERHGYARMTEGGLSFAIDVATLPLEPELATGFTCRAVTPADYPSLVRAFEDAFPAEKRTIASYERLAACMGYEPSLDLAIVDNETETVAAFCTAWYDRANHVGLFEPVGTRAAYRRRGFARAVMAEALRRLQRQGAASVVVRVRSGNADAIACYEDLGFTIASNVFGFEKHLD